MCGVAPAGSTILVTTPLVPAETVELVLAVAELPLDEPPKLPPPLGADLPVLVGVGRGDGVPVFVGVGVGVGVGVPVSVGLGVGVGVPLSAGAGVSEPVLSARNVA